MYIDMTELIQCFLIGIGLMFLFPSCRYKSDKSKKYLDKIIELIENEKELSDEI